ncbi:MAG: NAD(P)-dependent oxidoreductase [Deltaproteobacteria bacterium]|nr:NAD(P)-dependent oxidoreductase [Deltaproteobacteria bacterium]
MKIGFIGLGNLGYPLAMNLVRAGHDITVSDLRSEAGAGIIEAGAGWSDDIAGVCRTAEVVITALPSPEASRAVVEDAGGVFDNLMKGSCWIEMSTTDFEDIQRMAQIAREKGFDVLECPVTGGVHLAHTGEITVLVGGDINVYEHFKPILEVMGREVIHLGALGNASVVKVVTNMLAFIHLVAVGEGMMLAAKQGVDLGATYKAIRASSGNSFVHETESQVILNGSYNINFTMDLACKDLRFAGQIAEKLNVPLELGSMTRQIFERARNLFGNDAWSPKVVKMLEDACRQTLRAPGFPETLIS